MQSDAILVSHSGTVQVERDGQKILLKNGDAIHESDRILTGEKSVATLQFKDDSELELGENTNLMLSDFSYEEDEPVGFVLELAEGLMRSVSGEIVEQNPDAFKIVTPMSTIGIRGTTLLHFVKEGVETHIVVTLGEGHDVIVTSSSGKSNIITEALKGVTLGSISQDSFDVFDVSPEMLAPFENMFDTKLQGETVVNEEEETSSLFIVIQVAEGVQAIVETIITALQEVLPEDSLKILSGDSLTLETSETEEAVDKLIDNLLGSLIAGNELEIPQGGGDEGIIIDPNIGKTFNFDNFTGPDSFQGTAGDDVINITSISGGTINAGAGDDVINITGTISGGTINAGAGADKITINGVDAGAATIDFGDDTGADTLTFGTIDDAFLGGGFTLTLKNFNSGDMIDFSGVDEISPGPGDSLNTTIVFGTFTLDLGVSLNDDERDRLAAALNNGGVFTLT